MPFAAPPTLTAIDPTSWVGPGVLTLTATGTDFLEGAVIHLAASAQPTTFVSATTLESTGTIGHATPAGTFPITVVNPDGKETASLPLVYTVQAGAALLTLDAAKVHLRLTDTLHDADVQAKLDAAEAIILDYLKPTWTGGTARDDLYPWTADTVPRVVQAAILLMVTHLYEHRGDDMAPTATGTTPDTDVWSAIERLLVRFRDPALA